MPQITDLVQSLRDLVRNELSELRLLGKRRRTASAQMPTLQRTGLLNTPPAAVPLNPDEVAPLKDG